MSSIKIPSGRPELMAREYYPLKLAAELAGCTTSDMIHFGATGQLDIYLLQSLSYPYMIFEDDSEHPGGLRVIDPHAVGNEGYNVPLAGPQCITRHGMKEFEISPSTAKREFDWNKAIKLDSNAPRRWYFSNPGEVLEESQMVIMHDDFLKLRKKLKDAETAQAAVDAQGSHEDENIMPAPPVLVEAENMLKNGLGKHAVAAAFSGVHWSETQWNRNLADCPEWLKGALISKGKKGKGGESVWNPVLLAVTLQETKDISVLAITKVFRENQALHPWADEWHDMQSPFKSSLK